MILKSQIDRAKIDHEVVSENSVLWNNYYSNSQLRKTKLEGNNS